jgi:hypothetical protein
MLTEGSFRAVGSALVLYGGVRSFLRGRAPAVPKPASETVPDAPTPPAKPTAGSNAGKPGTAEQATVQTACFVAGTPVRLRYGCKPIEQVQKGDRILSRDQYNPSGPVVEQVVEETFIRTAPVIRLRVCGQELRPTGEHPFYVPGRGWVLAWSLRPGDVLHTLEGEAVRVERVEDKGEVERVYNVRVRELQTYFVGGDAWGFALWSHNTNGHQAGGHTPTDSYKAQLFERAGKPKSQSTVHGAQMELKGGQTEAAIKHGRAYDHITKVRNAQQGLLNRIAAIKRSLSNSNLSQAEIQALVDELSEASKLLDATEGFVPRS